ncbi:hypothetical protein ElyMa_005824400 [Elysia marginata]|uniref:Uncharacterized protein n=1 Tax=Elysia marginata TaxID=1093978 RepID=A0AAV4FVM9_9GAST|nr:hypothetical protein ElyMa_005824400 [Elysia marginata]
MGFVSACLSSLSVALQSSLGSGLLQVTQRVQVLEHALWRTVRGGAGGGGWRARNRAGFFFEFIGNNVTILRLQCNAVPASPNDFVMTINIYNATVGAKINSMAWISRGRQPEVLDPAAQGRLFVAGLMSSDNFDPGRLEILIFGYYSNTDQRFGCNVTKSNQGQTGEVNWIVTINKTGKSPVRVSLRSFLITHA